MSPGKRLELFVWRTQGMHAPVGPGGQEKWGVGSRWALPVTYREGCSQRNARAGLSEAWHLGRTLS